MVYPARGSKGQGIKEIRIRALGLQKRLGVIECRFRLAAEHPGDLFDARLAFDGGEAGERSILHEFLGHDELRMGRRGDLRKMGDAEHLMASPRDLIFCTDRVRDLAADVGVDLVEDEQRDGVLRGERGLSRRASRARFRRSRRWP